MGFELTIDSDESDTLSMHSAILHSDFRHGNWYTYIKHSQNIFESFKIHSKV